MTNFSSWMLACSWYSWQTGQCLITVLENFNLAALSTLPIVGKNALN